MDAANGSQNLGAGLSAIKYKTILPEGKTSGYKENEKVEFVIPPDVGYFDGKQSYLNIVVRNTTTSNTASYPCAFPAHVGAHALINRLQLQDAKGFELENIEQYNLYTGILNAYGNNTDTYETISKVEGVAAHNPQALHMGADDPKVNYFNPPNTGNVTANVVTSVGSVANTFCLPINLGLFSAFANEHMAYPNLDIGGSRLTIYLEEAKNALQSLASNFIEEATLQDGQTKIQNVHKFISESVDGNIVGGRVTMEAGAQRVIPDDSNAGFNMARIGYRVGMEIQDNAGIKGTIESMTIDGDGDLVIQTSGLHGSVDTSVLAVPPTFSYEIDKIELKLLETIPDPATVKQIRRVMTQGINYQTTQLTKISTPAQLVNAVVDIPSALTRGLSIMVSPVQTDKIGKDNAENSLLYPQPDNYYPGNNNEYTYQWQVKNILIPNRELRITGSAEDTVQNDNPTFFNQQVMALRPMREVRALGDSSLKENDVELSQPFFIPILLTPVGSSFDLVDTDPQLRIKNSSKTPANILAKLHHVYINHTRKLVANDGGVMVEL
tara:strand:- start:182 stop:1840 length:1659 start_codon:yes stop_codon:yes gene_type:complete